MGEEPEAAVIELTGHSGLVVALAYSPDGRTLASASADGTARLWDLATGKLTATLQSPAARAYCVAFAPDGKSLAVGYGGPVGLVQVWGMDLTRRRQISTANSPAVRGVAFNSDGTLLAFGGDEHIIWLWRDGERVPRSVQAGRLTTRGVTFSPDDRFLAAITWRPATVRLWQTDSWRPYRNTKELSDWGYSIAFHPAGDRLVVGLERTIAVWDPADYRPPTVWPAHAGAVLGVAFTSDGQPLLTGGADGLVKLWDPAGRLRHTFDWKVGDVGAVAFAPDGLTAAAGGDGTILVWDVAE